MAASTNEHARQYQVDFVDEGHPESKFSRSPWEKSEYRELNQAPVTMWVGIGSIIVGITIQDVEPDTLEVSILGTRLIFRGIVRNRFFSQDVVLPCAVDVHPIHITPGKGILYVLLVKKREAEAVRDEGYADRYQPMPALTMSGA